MAASSVQVELIVFSHMLRVHISAQLRVDVMDSCGIKNGSTSTEP